jgi:hypothetical protein
VVRYAAVATKVKPKPRTSGPRDEGEELCHIVTDEDPDTALCGKDVTGWPWNPPWPLCVVCADLAGLDQR